MPQLMKFPLISIRVMSYKKKPVYVRASQFNMGYKLIHKTDACFDIHWKANSDALLIWKSYFGKEKRFNHKYMY